MGRPTTPNGWCRAEFFFVGQEKQWSVVFWGDFLGAVIDFSTFDFVANGTLMISQYRDPLLALMASTTHFKGAYFLWNDSANTIGFDNYGANESGTGGGDSIPEDVSVVVQELSAHPGKTGRGRIFLSGIAQALCTGSYTNAGMNAPMAALVAIVKGSTVLPFGGTFTPSVFSNKDSQLYHTVAVNGVQLLKNQRRRRARF